MAEVIPVRQDGVPKVAGLQWLANALSLKSWWCGLESNPGLLLPFKYYNFSSHKTIKIVCRANLLHTEPQMFSAFYNFGLFAKVKNNGK